MKNNFYTSKHQIMRYKLNRRTSSFWRIYLTSTQIDRFVSVIFDPVPECISCEHFAYAVNHRNIDFSVPQVPEALFVALLPVSPVRKQLHHFHLTNFLIDWKASLSPWKSLENLFIPKRLEKISLKANLVLNRIFSNFLMMHIHIFKNKLSIN